MKIQTILHIILLVIAGLFTQPRSVAAACNFHQLMTSESKDVSNFTSTCTITGVEGVDNPQNSETSTTTNASITLGTNGAITINNGGTLVVNSLSITGGTITIQTGGQIKLNTPLYVADADADGYAVDFTLYTASVSGRRRLGLMHNFTTVDCYDANANAKPGSTTCSATNRGDGSYDYNCSSTNTTCGSAYYTENSYSATACNPNQCEGGFGTVYCAGSQVGCGQAGKLIGGGTSQTSYCGDSIPGESGCGGNSYCDRAQGASGTQACQ